MGLFKSSPNKEEIEAMEKAFAVAASLAEQTADNLHNIDPLLGNPTFAPDESNLILWCDPHPICGFRYPAPGEFVIGINCAL